MLKRSLTDEKRAEVLMRLNENIQRAGHLENVFGNVHNILDSYELEFTRKTGLTKIDWGFLFVATAMQICRQYLLTSFADRINDQDAAKRVKGGKKEHSDRSHRYYQPSLNEIITNPVPFDANVGSNGALTGGGYFGHRGRTLGHDPLLGLVFGTANIATSTLTTTTFESYHITTGARKNGGTQDVFGNHADTFKVLMRTYDKIVNEGMDGRAKVSASLVKEVVHLKSDIGSIKGLPLPIVEVFSADLASDLAKWGFDSTNLVTVGKQVAFSVLINQLISLVHTLFNNETNEDARKLYQVRTRKILMYSNVIASGTNLAVVAITRDLRKLDVGGLMVTLWRLISDLDFIQSVKEDFISDRYISLIKS